MVREFLSSQAGTLSFTAHDAQPFNREDMPRQSGACLSSQTLGFANTMFLVRSLIWLQFFCFLLGPPVALASVLGDVRWALVVIPWGLCCAFLFGHLQGSGRIKYGEEKYLPIAWLQVPDSIHIGLLGFNGAIALVIAAAIQLRMP